MSGYYAVSQRPTVKRKMVPLVDNRTRHAHDDAADNHSRDVRRRPSNSSTGHEDHNIDNIDPAHIEAIQDLARQAEDSKAGKAVGQTYPWEELDITKRLVQTGLDIGDITDIVSCAVRRVTMKKEGKYR